jgi:hypothetical protein
MGIADYENSTPQSWTLLNSVEAFKRFNHFTENTKVKTYKVTDKCANKRKYYNVNPKNLHKLNHFIQIPKPIPHT